jgi:parallel beta-helix repeat protein
MNTIRTSAIFPVLTGLLGFAAGIACLLFVNANAGDLEPTAPPGPTMKTLDEVEPRIPITSVPFNISSPGSYYFTGDLTSAMYGINVSADNVTIDLMGYTLAYGASASAYGIYINGRNNVEIRNGTVRDFASMGIHEHSYGSKGHRIINVRVVSNGNNGIRLNGHGHLVKDCHATGNLGSGIITGDRSTISGNTCSDNAYHGIHGSSGSTISGNTCHGNGWDGIGGHSGCTVSGNTCHENGSSGIDVDHSCTMSGNTCYNNSYDGIQTGSGGTIFGNTCYLNDHDGIYAGSGSSVLGNTTRYSQNWGIYLQGDNFVAQNSATYNNQSGGAYGNMNSSATSTYGLNHRP